MSDEFRVGSLFSGVEGFGLGFTLAGADLLWVSEIDKHASKVLEKRFPGVPNHGDITGIAPERLGDVDCITFGFPCQDLSVAGHRAGLAGDRSGLFWEALRVIAAKRPRWIVAENVPGLLSSNQGEDFGVVLWALAALGYGVAYAVLDAQHFGVPQRRRRVFIVGCLGDAERARQVLADAPGGYRDPTPSGGPQRVPAGRVADGVGVAGTLRSNPYNNSNPACDPLTWGDPSGVARTTTTTTSRFDPTGETLVGHAHVAGGLTASRKGLPDEPVLDAGRSAFGDDVSHTLRGEGCDASEDGTGRGTPIVFDVLQDPINGSIAGALSGRGRQGVARVGGHPPRSTHLRSRGSVGADEDDGRGQDQHGPLAAEVDAAGDGAPSRVPGWLDLPMWQGGQGARALCLDGEAARGDRGEEGGEDEGPETREREREGSGRRAPFPGPTTRTPPRGPSPREPGQRDGGRL